ncbi:MAG: aspartate 1-decarboxylase [Candidatus Aminicenantales bacterium]
MRRTLLKAKIQKARVTEARLEYEGSLGLDESLVEAAGMVPFEMVHVYNISNGERFSTYLIKEEKDSGKVGIYGAAAHKVNVGDCLIIVSYAQLEDDEIEFFMPRMIILDDNNKIKEIK